MTEDEMEYEGGFLNFIAAAVCTAASIGCNIAARVTGNDTYNKIAFGLDVASAALSFGVGGLVTSSLKAVAKGVAVNTLKSTTVRVCSVINVASKSASAASATLSTYKGADVVSNCYSAGMTVCSIPFGGPFGIFKW